jgi:hypothetical protein
LHLGAGIAGTAIAALGAREGFFMATRGLVVGPRTSRNASGFIERAPTDLAAAAGWNLNTYALARALSSEHGQDGPTVKTAIAWAIKNAAAKSGRGLFEQLTRQLRRDGSPGPAHMLFGGQNAGGVPRYAATGLDPREQEIQISSAVLMNRTPDPTGGATNFFSPKGQRAANAKDPAKNKTAEALLASWLARGLSVRPVAGIDPELVTFFG